MNFMIPRLSCRFFLRSGAPKFYATVRIMARTLTSASSLQGRCTSQLDWCMTQHWRRTYMTYSFIWRSNINWHTKILTSTVIPDTTEELFPSWFYILRPVDKMRAEMRGYGTWTFGIYISSSVHAGRLIRLTHAFCCDESGLHRCYNPSFILPWPHPGSSMSTKHGFLQGVADRPEPDAFANTERGGRVPANKNYLESCCSIIFFKMDRKTFTAIRVRISASK